MKVYGQLERAQIEGLTSDPVGANLVVGRMWFRTDTQRYKVYDGSAVKEFVDLVEAQTLQNKILDSAQLNTPIVQGASTYNQIGSTPANPSAGNHKVYFKNDGKLYTLDALGNEVEVGSGAGGGQKNYFDDTSANIDNTVGSWETDDGAGSASAGLTLSVTNLAGELLAGAGSLKIEKDAADRDGHFIKVTSETIDPSDRGRPNYGSFEFRPLTGYESSDFIFEAYDVTNAAVLYSGVTEDLELLNARGRFNWVTYLEDNTEEVEFRVKVNNANTNAFSAVLDEFKFGPTNQLIFQDGPIAEILAVATDTAPSSDFLLCDGSAVSRTQYAELFAAIGTTHGQGDGSTTFNIPDYRGRFLRGVAQGSTRDPDRASRGAMNTGGNTGDNVGSVQTDATARPNSNFTGTTNNDTHSHTASVYAGGGGATTRFSAQASNGAFIGSASTNNDTHSHSFSVTGGGDAETRPTNAYVNYFIRVRSTKAIVNTNELSQQTMKTQVFLGGNQSISDVNSNEVAFNNIAYDTHGMADLANNGIKILKNGYYDVLAGVNLSAIAAGEQMVVDFRVNGAQVYRAVTRGGSVTGDIFTTLNKTLFLQKDNIVTCRVESDTDNSYSVRGDLSGVNTFLQIESVPDYTVFGVVKNHEILEVETSIGHGFVGNANTWYVPTTSFSLTLSPGTYNLYSQVYTDVVTTGGNARPEVALSTSTTPGTDIIRRENASGGSTTSNIDRTRVTIIKVPEYVVTEETTIYVHVYLLNTSGFSTSSSAQLGSIGNADSRLIAERIK